MHAECEHSAGGEGEAVEIDGHLLRIEDRDGRNRREAADDRGSNQFKSD